MFGDGKTAVRAGFGQYIERLRQNNFNFGAGGQFPNGGGFTVFNTNVDAITPGPPPATVYPDSTYTPRGYSIFPVGNTMPTIYSWNFGVQRDLGHNFALDLSYVGNHGIHLMIQRLVNGTGAGYYLDHPNALPSVNYFSEALRPYLGYSGITSIETSGLSSYNAMLVRLSRRFSNRLSFNVNYTWSKTMDLVDSDDAGSGGSVGSGGVGGDIINPLNLRRNWAPAGYDATHSVTVDYLYQLPDVKGALDNMVGRAVLNGWQVSGITHYQSGFPITVASYGDLKGIDAGIQTVNLAGDPYAGLSNGRFLNGQAFQRPPDGQFGSLGRNALRQPGFGNWDFSLAKNIKIKESMNMKIACDVFNMWNHPQIWGIQNGWAADNPGGGINTSTAGTFGTITSYKPARVLQFGFKFTF